ncbi:MAG: hypothetical protein HC908_02060 [Calothrix sp. SM1_7_51]|nr:hypothetical protein [Calothrix sp. SM1_7_51]
MKLNYLMERLSTIRRFLAAALVCIAATAFIWYLPFFSNTAANANPATNFIATADAGDKVQEKVSKDAKRAKNFIRDTADKVEETASKNASRVEDATDNNGSFVERKAKRDAARIHQKAELDAARTQKAVDKTKNAVERTVDNIKDALGN